jgi:hypothetical protein
LVYLLVLLLPISYSIFFWGFYFLPFSVHVQTNVIYVPLLSLLLFQYTFLKWNIIKNNIPKTPSNLL